MLNTIEGEFDLILSDTGSQIDNGLAYGALAISNFNFCIMTQQESCLSRFEGLKERYKKGGIFFSKYIVNKFEEKDPHNITYISKRLDISKKEILIVENVDYSRQAEMENRTLVEFRDERYLNCIINISNIILGDLKEPIITKEKKRSGKILSRFI